jgi:hypothetical protein
MEGAVQQRRSITPSAKLQNRPKVANKFSPKKPANTYAFRENHDVVEVEVEGDVGALESESADYFDISPRQPLQRLASYDLNADYEVG